MDEKFELGIKRILRHQLCNMYPACYMEWLRLVCSWKLQFSFAEYRLFYRALLQKRPMRILRSLLYVSRILYGVATISRLLKITFLFWEDRLFCRALLQKRPRILRGLLIVATPYAYVCIKHIMYMYIYIYMYIDI